MQENQTYIQDDKISFNELWQMLIKRKLLIILITAGISMLGVAYAVFAKPVFGVKAVMELAQIDKNPVQNLIDLKQKLEVVFEVNAKGKKIELPIISDVDLPKKTKNIMVLQAQGYDNASAQLKLQEIIDYVLASQDKELASFTSTQQEKLALVKQEINRNEQLVKEIEESIKDYDNRLFNISKKDAALAGIYAIEIGKRQAQLDSAKYKIYSLQNINKDLELSISPLKMQKATVLGAFEVSDYPVKPKKKLIVAVAFITGLMLSIFLVFVLEFMQGAKKREA